MLIAKNTYYTVIKFALFILFSILLLSISPKNVFSQETTGIQITSVACDQNFNFTIKGYGFGEYPSYDGNSPYLLVNDVSGDWDAGYIGLGENDAVHLNVTKWTDNQIIINGFSGAYGNNGWNVNTGDQLRILVWNANTNFGPAIYNLQFTKTAVATGNGDFVFNQDTAITLPVNTNVLPHTIEAWVKPQLRTDQNSPGYNYGVYYPPNAISNDNPGSGGHGFGLNVWPDGSELIIGNHSNWRVVPNINFTAAQWYYIAVVYTTGNVKTYVNGSMVDDYSYDEKKLDGVNYIRIGKHNDDSYWGTHRFFNGSISAVAIWNVAKNGAEIAQDMNNVPVGQEAGLIGYWPGSQRPTASGSLPLPSAGSYGSNIKIVIDGRLQSYQQPPVMVDDRVLVPLRSIFEKLGATVDWDDASQSVTAIDRFGTRIWLQIGSNTAYIDGQKYLLDVPAQVINDRTMVPVRFVAESLGCQVDWIGTTNTVSIDATNMSKPPKVSFYNPSDWADYYLDDSLNIDVVSYPASDATIVSMDLYIDDVLIDSSRYYPGEKVGEIHKTIKLTPEIYGYKTYTISCNVTDNKNKTGRSMARFNIVSTSWPKPGWSSADSGWYYAIDGETTSWLIDGMRKNADRAELGAMLAKSAAYCPYTEPFSVPSEFFLGIAQVLLIYGADGVEEINAEGGNEGIYLTVNSIKIPIDGIKPRTFYSGD